MKKKILVTIVGMTLAFVMLTACGSEGKDTTTADTEVSTQTTDENESEAKDTSDSAEEVTESTDNSASEEFYTRNNLSNFADMISIATYNEEKGYKSADGKCIWNVFNYGILSKAVEDLFYNNYEYISDGYNPSVEYVEVDGEQWYELTFDIDAFINKVGGKDYFEENFTKYNYREEDKDGDGLNDYDTMKYDENGKFIVLVSTDFTKLKYKDVTFTEQSSTVE